MTREVDWNALIAEEKERMSGNCPAEDLYAPVFEMKTGPSIFDGRMTRKQLNEQAALYRRALADDRLTGSDRELVALNFDMYRTMMLGRGYDE